MRLPLPFRTPLPAFALATLLAATNGAVVWRTTARTLARLGADTTARPLGDGRTSDAPRRGHLWSCLRAFPGGGGAFRRGPWIRGGRWYPGEKPHVEGDVAWPDARITIAREGARRVVRANALPTHHTGEFPVRPGTAAWAYDRNPNAIRAGRVVLDLPAEPDTAVAPSCVPMGPIGVATSGTAIFDAVDLAGRDAPAHEVQDRCDGHPEPGGRYHYHGWSPCLADADGAAGRHSALAGWIVDGIPIFGPRGEGGVPLTSADLDACHGHAHAVTIDGVTAVRWHYHFTPDFPYTVGCLRARPVALPRPAGPPPAGPAPPPPGRPAR